MRQREAITQIEAKNTGSLRCLGGALAKPSGSFREKEYGIKFD
jgi:hypothetical protein